MKFKKWFFLLFFFLEIYLGLLVGCQSSSNQNSKEQLNREISVFEKTVTARANNQPDQYPTSQELQIASIHAELPFYGLDDRMGQLGWIHAPVSLQTEQDHQAIYQNDYTGIIAKDFLVVGDITLNTTLNASGCGFTVRVHKNGIFMDHYLILITRMVNGYALFSAITEGIPVNLREIYADGNDPNFAWENGSTNRLAVLVRVNKISIYTNKILLGTIDITEPPSKYPNLPPTPIPPPSLSSEQALSEYESLEQSFRDISASLELRYRAISQSFREYNSQFAEGFIGLAAVNSSGTTSCKFSNTWLWILQP